MSSRARPVQPSSSSILRLRLFGVLSFGIALDGGVDVPQHVPGRPGTLLAYLALARGRYLGRGELVSALWPDHADGVGAGTFNTVLWRLRSLLEGPPFERGSLITCDRGGVGLNPHAPIELDVDAFARNVLPALAKPLERMEPADVEALRSGVALYTADILTDLGDEWALREREKHRRHYLNALGRLMQVCTLAKDFATAIRHAQSILDHDALREDVHRDLMRLFLQSGQRALALRQFETCRTALRRELAIQPMQETLLLYHAIADRAVVGELARTTADPLVATSLAALPREVSAGELVAAARRHLAEADAHLRLTLPLL